MNKRHNKGWFQVNHQEQKHYWYQETIPGIWHSLCGKLADPVTFDAWSDKPTCRICDAIRRYELHPTKDASIFGVYKG